MYWLEGVLGTKERKTLSIFYYLTLRLPLMPIFPLHKPLQVDGIYIVIETCMTSPLFLNVYDFGCCVSSEANPFMTSGFTDLALWFTPINLRVISMICDLHRFLAYTVQAALHIWLWIENVTQSLLITLWVTYLIHCQ